MNEDKLLSINECCELLKVSRPTFDKIRKQYSLLEYLIGSRPRFSKNEIANKILYNSGLIENRRAETSSETEAVLIHEVNLDKSFSGKDLDISRFIHIDAYYASSFLCKLIAESAQGDRKIYDSKGLMIPYFQKINFLTYIQKFSADFVEVDPLMFAPTAMVFPEIILPISQVGFKTAEKKYLEEIRAVLRTQGFSNEIGDYIGWSLGELADNSHTHSHTGAKVFISIERLSSEKHNFLQINILDMGEGIHTTLKKNEKYKELSDEKALLLAFKSKVSSWGDEYNRGKGLTDILKIAFECNSFFRVESCDLAFLFYCQDKRREIKKINSLTKTSGTRFSITLVDNKFRETKRSEVDQFIDEFLEKL